MMILSRIWYVVLSLLLGVALYVAYLAVGEYNRNNRVAMNEELASDSQTVGWSLQIDARKRLDSLLLGAVDKGIVDSLQSANTKDTIPAKVKEDGRRALSSVLDKIPAEFKPTALFAVDHDGRVVAQVGFDAANSSPDFELGGYPAVFDAIHGFLRDDTWVLGGKIYRVSARPVEFDATQPPLGAIVGLRLVDQTFAKELAKRTRASIAFYAGGQRVVSAAAEGFDESQLDLLDTDLPKLEGDKEYAEGRSEVRDLSDKVGVKYARLFGDAWDLGAGFAVARSHKTIADPLGFLNGADDKDKQSVPFPILAGIVVVGILLGIVLSMFEHSMPMGEMRRQALRLKKGEIDYFQLPRFRGGFRPIAQDVNSGIERVLEKGGGAARKPADLESILGPVPAQPSMSAFSFPLTDPSQDVPAVPPAKPPAGPAAPAPSSGNASSSDRSSPGLFGPPPNASGTAQGVGALGAMGAGAVLAAASAPRPPPPKPSPHGPPPLAQSASGVHPAPNAPGAAGFPQTSMPTPFNPVRPVGAAQASALAPPTIDTGLMNEPAKRPGPPPRPGAATMLGVGAGGSALSPATAPHDFAPAGGRPAHGSRPHVTAPTPSPQAAPQRPISSGAVTPAVPTATASGRQLPSMTGEESEDEATVVAPAPSELLAQSQRGTALAGNDNSEWMSVYDDFVRTKKQCGEAIEGLTFEKFSATLRKNRDALMQRHNCKKVRFSVYVKDGRASLKATPVRE